LRKKQKKFPKAVKINKQLDEQNKARRAEANKSGVNQQELQEQREQREKEERDKLQDQVSTIHVQSEEGTGFDKELKLRPQEKKKVRISYHEVTNHFLLG
jgi:hypothetical protein